jgi:uncharacterized protein (TIGR00730 family)
MDSNLKRRGPYPAAHEGAKAALIYVDSPQTRSPSYKLAFQDSDFLLRDDCRPVRLQLEFLKPELILQEHHIESTIVLFGSARIPNPEKARKQFEAVRSEVERNPSDPSLKRKLETARRVLGNSRYYDEARKLARIVSEISQSSDKADYVVTTGGGPGIMEAANRGAYDAGAKSIGLNIVLPQEQAANPYITPDLSFQFHYFALRKMHFLMRAKALVVFPGGYGTMDELFETLVLVQTHKIKPIPVLLFGKEFWDRVIRFDVLVEEGTISEEDIRLFKYVETAEDAWEHIRQANNL